MMVPYGATFISVVTTKQHNQAVIIKGPGMLRSIGDAPGAIYPESIL